MHIRLCCLLILLVAGCHLPHNGARIGGDPVCIDERAGIPYGGDPACGPEMGPRPCPPAEHRPQVCPPPEVRHEAPPCKEIHVKAPRQKVRVQQPAGAAGGAQLVEQQVAQTRQLVLVPQQVYVPFIQATNFGAVRVNGAQQTQFFNAQGLVTQGVVAQGAAAGIAAQGAVGAGAGGVNGATFGAGMSAEEARKCQEELKAAASALREMKGMVEKLEAQVQSLKKNRPEE